MSEAAAAVLQHPPEETATGVPTGKLGLWLFLASEVMFFTGLVGSYIVLRLGSRSWPEPSTVLATPVLAVNTFVLILSSVTMVLALQSIRRGDRAGLKKFLFATILLGSTFLVIKLLDYRHMIHEGFTITTNMFGSCYYMLTGFHGLHVFAGVVTLTVLLCLALAGHFSPEEHGYVEYTGLYWHFVDLVWILLFAILCLV